jgi:hypothetical protein
MLKHRNSGSRTRHRSKNTLASCKHHRCRASTKFSPHSTPNQKAFRNLAHRRSKQQPTGGPKLSTAQYNYALKQPGTLQEADLLLMYATKNKVARQSSPAKRGTDPGRPLPQARTLDLARGPNRSPPQQLHPGVCAFDPRKEPSFSFCSAFVSLFIFCGSSHRRIFLFHRITCADALLMARPGRSTWTASTALLSVGPTRSHRPQPSG